MYISNCTWVFTVLGITPPTTCVAVRVAVCVAVCIAGCVPVRCTNVAVLKSIFTTAFNLY